MNEWKKRYTLFRGQKTYKFTGTWNNGHLFGMWWGPYGSNHKAMESKRSQLDQWAWTSMLYDDESLGFFLCVMQRWSTVSCVYVSVGHSTPCWVVGLVAHQCFEQSRNNRLDSRGMLILCTNSTWCKVCCSIVGFRNFTKPLRFFT